MYVDRINIYILLNKKNHLEGSVQNQTYVGNNDLIYDFIFAPYLILFVGLKLKWRFPFRRLCEISKKSEFFSGARPSNTYINTFLYVPKFARIFSRI